MSLFGSLFTGVSALAAQSNALGVISNNIANVNTTGFKRGVASFSSLVTSTGSASSFSPGGVRATALQTVDQQGLLQNTNSATDIAISGNGFFIVKDGSASGADQLPLYTRAGSFTEDKAGFLRNASGFILQGWRLDANGNLPASNADMTSVEPVDVSFANGLAAPTSQVALGANLQADVTPAVSPAFNFTRSITVFDNLGNNHVVNLNFRKEAAVNEWTVEFDIPNASHSSSHTILFDGAGLINEIDGVPVSTGGSTVSLNGIDWDDNISGALDSDIDINIGNLTQFASDFSVAFVEQDGAELGLRTGININAQGQVVATFSNGQVRPLFQLPIATFNNPNGLEARSGNVFAETETSGSFSLRVAGTSGAGVISPSSIEASNVDLADEFTRMIITQRAYSGGTRVITTADRMLEELLRIQ